MAIKFKYDGIEFEVSTPREAAQVVRELRRVNRPAPTFSPPSLAAVVEKAQRQREGDVRHVFEQAAQNTQDAVLMFTKARAEASAEAERLEMVLRFLTALQRAGRMNVDEVGRVLKINHPKGLGPRSMLINNVLLQHGFEAEQVYSNTERNRDGSRVWASKAKLQDAISAIEQAKQKELMFS
jgi:hypothetical protein